MVAVPNPAPVTMPVEPTEAIPELLLLQVPPDVPSDKGDVVPRQILTGPGGAIATGVILTVKIAPTAHPVPIE